MDQPQDWLGYDFLKAEARLRRPGPDADSTIEIRDAATRDYWTRVNYETVVPPGRSTLIIPVKQLYVGEKSRPGRMLDLAQSPGWSSASATSRPAPLLLDNVRLERDDSVARVAFAGLYAFDFGPEHQPRDGRLHPDHPGDAL